MLYSPTHTHLCTGDATCWIRDENTQTHSISTTKAMSSLANSKVFIFYPRTHFFFFKPNDIPSVSKWALLCFLYLNVYFVKANITCTFKIQCLRVLVNASFWYEIKTTIRPLTRTVKTISTCKTLQSDYWLPDSSRNCVCTSNRTSKTFDALIPREPLNTVQSIYKN